jgi:hypothetical protein
VPIGLALAAVAHVVLYPSDPAPGDRVASPRVVSSDTHPQ